MLFNHYEELTNEYHGSDRKKTLRIDGKKYLLKFPDPLRKQKAAGLSYINNALSEYIGCKIYQSLKIPAQDVMLGIWREQSGAEKIACACKDFREDGYDFFDAEAMLLSKTDEGIVNQTDLCRLLSFISEMGSVSKKMKDRFYDMFVVDCLICNYDRHNGNWGLLIHRENGKRKVAPVFDCGSSLSPLFPDDMLDEKTAKSALLSTYSAITLKGKRINSSQYIKSCVNPDLNAAVLRIFEKFDMDKIDKLIEKTPYISSVRKSYYKDMLRLGFNLILMPAVKKISR